MQDNFKLRTMSEVETEQVRWLTKPYLPGGRISLILGNPGEGKTTLALAIAAAVTTGTQLPWEDTPREAGDVIFQTAEDCYSDTIKPRLELLGADCSRVHFVDDNEVPLTLADERLEKAIAETHAVMLVADPVQGFLGNSDINNANAMRSMMKSLGSVAERTECAVILIGHLNKQGKKSVYRGLGSIDIYAAARSVLMVGRIPVDDNMRAFVHSKSNLSSPGASQAFGFDAASGFTWLGEYGISVDEMLAGKPKDENTLSQKDIAMTFLMGELSGGTKSSAEIMRSANAHGIAEITLRRAKKLLGVKSFQSGGEWVCSLGNYADAHLPNMSE
jgi:KaiC/GvpD/RAD55 family RecA-like ATPase